jgi:RHS repeat-associated protein
MVRKLLLFLLVIIYSNLNAQYLNVDKPKKDTVIDYYLDVSNQLLVKLFTSRSYLQLEITNKESNDKIAINPLGILNIGGSFNYKWIGIGVFLGLPSNEIEVSKKGKTSRLDLVLNVYNKRFLIDGFYQTYKGYHLANALTVAEWKSDTLPQFSDFRQKTLNITGFYIFNHNKFSLKSAFVRNVIQLKSAGSLIAGVFFNYDAANNSSGFLDNDSIKVDLKNKFPFTAFSSITLGFSFGYSYNFVFSKCWYANVTAAAGFGINQFNADTLYFDSLSILSNGSINKTNIGSIVLLRASVGYEKIEYRDGAGNVRATCYSGIDDGCMNIPVKHDLPYYSQRSVDVHVPNIAGQQLKWYWNTSRNCGQTNFVEIKLFDLITGNQLIESTDYTINGSQIFDFTAGPYNNKNLYLRIQYNYTDAYIGPNGAYYTGIYNSSSHQPFTGNNFPSQSFGYILDYSDWTLNYYDEKGNITKIIPPEGVDCNGTNPSTGYASETYWEDYDVYQPTTYPFNPAYAFTFYDYYEDPSHIFTDETSQTHKIELELQTRQYIPNYSSADPCDQGTTGTFGDAQADLNSSKTGYVSAVVSEYFSNSSTYNQARLVTSDSLSDNLRLITKLDELSADSLDIEARIAENLSQQAIVGDKLTLIDSLINHGPFCLDFDGVNDYMETSGLIIDQIADGDFTFEAKIKGDETTIGNHPTIFCNRSSPRSGMKLFFHNIWGGSSYKMLGVQLDGVNYIVINNGTYNGSLLDNTCHHVAVTRKDDSLYFYADGNLFGKRQVSGTPDISTGLDLRIGSDRSNVYPFEGIISDVRIWNTALHDTIISQNLNVIVPSISSNLIANWDMNDALDEYIVNEVNNDTTQLGSSSSSDGNDPQWVSSCCNDSVSLVKLEYEEIMLEAMLDKLTDEDTTLNELLAVNDTIKSNLISDGYYPIEPNKSLNYVFIQDSVIVGDTSSTMRVLPSGNVIIDPDPPFDPDPPLGPCYNKPAKLIATFHFQIELLIYDGSNVGYVQPNGTVSSSPYSYSVYPELYKTCQCEYYWNQVSLASLGKITINNQELNDYPDGIRFNIKNINVAKSPGNFQAFNDNDGIHKFARYLHFFTYMTHTRAPITNDNISHSMESIYGYDNLNQRIYVNTPDAGEAESLYDEQGNLRFTQEAQQKIEEKFSYVNYDRAGRPVESGVYEYSNTLALQFQNHAGIPAIGGGETSVLTVLDEIDGLSDTYCSEQTYTLYDIADVSGSPNWFGSTLTNYKQTYLLGRVSKTWNENSIMWYSYDMYGRIVWTIEYIKDVNIADYKIIDYEYDPAGNVIKTIYQDDDATEYFEHLYSYDNGQKLINVETSEDGVSYDQQAAYSYYQHGPLKRTEIGNELQGIDYVYTIDGKLKAINSPNLGVASGGTTFYDPGMDGEGASTVYTDIFGMVIDYHDEDYLREGTYINYGLGTNQKYSGTINQVRWNMDETVGAVNLNLTSAGKQNVYQYEYTDLNWLAAATFGAYTPTCYHNQLPADNCLTAPTFTADASNQFKVSGITYDKNGNIETFIRNGNTTTGINMDNLTYHYNTTTQADGDVVKTSNRLNYVSDTHGSVYGIDIGNQSSSNYTYNAIGEATNSVLDDEDYTYYTTGLAKEIKQNSTGYLKLKFEYNALGHRLKKIIYDGLGSAETEVFYVNDANGNLLTTYERDVSTTAIVQDYSIAGANLLGMYDPSTSEARYFMYDHLGNVRATFREYTSAIEVLSVNEFYPFGLVMPGRNAVNTIDKLNLGYQGKELDQTGFHHFGSRQWDARLARWITTDPAGQFHSPYLGMGNNPVNGIDPNGELFLFDDLIVGGISFAAGYLHSGFTSGNWGWSSIGKGALWAGTAILALNTGGLSYSPAAAAGLGAQLAGSQLAGAFLPSFNIPLTNNLSFNLSPSVAFGNNGGFGISYGLTAQAGGFSVTAGAGASSGADIAFYGAGYDNGSFGFSLYRTKYWSGSTSQTLGGLGLHLGDVNLNYQNDWPWGDGGDRYRTAALQATYKGFSIGTNLFTGDPGLDGNTREREGYTLNNKGEKIGGVYTKNKYGDNPDTHREGILYAGYGNYRFGINSEKVRHVIQNKIAHDFLMGSKSGHFRILNTPTTGYFHYGPTNPFSLWR